MTAVAFHRAPACQTCPNPYFLPTPEESGQNLYHPVPRHEAIRFEAGYTAHYAPSDDRPRDWVQMLRLFLPDRLAGLPKELTFLCSLLCQQRYHQGEHSQ